MTDLLSRPLPSPKNWQDFEMLMFDLHRRVWKTNDAEMHGRTGQPQNGVDIYGTDRVEGKYAGIQCKGKDSEYGATLTAAELRSEVNKALMFQPPLDVFTLVTTAPNDAAIQAVAREITEAHREIGKFEVRVRGWDTLRIIIMDHKDLVQKHFADFAPVDLLAKIDSGHVEEERHYKSIISVLGEHSQLLTGLQSGGADSGDALAERAKELAKLVEDGNPSAAITALSRLLSENEATASPIAKYRILANIGAAHLALGCDDEAKSYFVSAANANPEYPGATALLSTVALIDEDHPKAFDLAKDTLARESDNMRAVAIFIDAAPAEMDMEAIIAALPDCVIERWETKFHLSHKAHQRGLAEKALELSEQALTLAPEKWQTKSQVASCLMEALSEIEGVALTRDIPEELQPQYNRALQLLRDAWGMLSRRESTHSGKHVAANFLALLELSGLNDEANSVLDEAIRQNPDYDPLLHRFAVRAIGVNDWNAADTAISKMNLELMEFDSLLLYAQIKIHTRQIAAASDAADRMTRAAANAGQDEFAAAINLEARALTSDDIRCLSEDALTTYPRSVIIRSVLLDLLVDDEDMQARIQSELEEIVKGELSSREKIHAGEALYALGKFSLAADQFATLHGTQIDSHILRRHLQALHLADRRVEARKLFESLPPGLQASDRYSNIGVAIYERAGLLKAALKLLVERLRNDDTLRNRLAWMQMSMRLDRVDFVDGWLRNVSPDIAGTPDELMTLAHYVDEYLEGDVKALELAYRALKDGYSDPQMHLGYAIGIVINGKAAQNLGAAPEKVSVGTGVVLRNVNEPHDLIFRLVVTHSAMPEREEVNADDALAKLLLDKRRGDQISIPKTGLPDSVYSLEEIHSRFMFTHFKVLRNFPDLFPGHPAFGTFEIVDSKGDENFEPMFSMARDRADFANKIRATYRNGVAPLPMLAKFTGSSIFELWDSFASGEDGFIKVAEGSAEEFEEGRSSASAPIIVVDPLAIYSWIRIGIIEIISKVSDRLCVVQSSIDLLHLLLDERLKNRGRRMATFGFNGENYVMSEMTPEAHDRHIDDAQRAFDFANSLRLVPAETDAAITNEVREALDYGSGAYYDSLIASLDPQRALLTDDFGFRVLGASAGARMCWTQPLLQFSLKNSRITFTEYRHAIATLVLCRYEFTMFGHREISDCLREIDWMADDSLNPMLSVMAKATIDEPSLVQTLVHLIVEGRKDEVSDAQLASFHIALDTRMRANEGDQKAKRVYRAVLAGLAKLFARNIKQVKFRSALYHTTNLKTPFEIGAEFDKDAADAARDVLARLANGGLAIL